MNDSSSRSSKSCCGASSVRCRIDNQASNNIINTNINTNNNTNNSTNNNSNDVKDSKERMTIAQREAYTKHEEQNNNSIKNGIRKSKRLLSFTSQPRIKTTKLRRLHELFWFDDAIYSSCSCSCALTTSTCSCTKHKCKCTDANGDHHHVTDTDTATDANANAANDNDLPCEMRKTRRNSINAKKNSKKQFENNIKVSQRLFLKRIHSSPNVYIIDDFLRESEFHYLNKKIQVANEQQLFHDSYMDDAERKRERKRSAVNAKVKMKDKDKDKDGGEAKRRKKVVRTNTHANANTYGDGDGDGNSGRKNNGNANDDGDMMKSVVKLDVDGDVYNDNERMHSANNNSIGRHKNSKSTCAKRENMQIATTATNQRMSDYGVDSDNRSKNCKNSNSISNSDIIKKDDTTAQEHNQQQLPPQDKVIPDSTYFHQRTSQFIHFTKQLNSTISSIEQRACNLLSLPNDNIEPLQLVKYDIGQYFNVHHDLGTLYDDGSVELPLRKNVLLSPPRRIVTILVYLNDVEECHGGSTQFPLLKPQTQQKQHATYGKDNEYNTYKGKGEDNNDTNNQNRIDTRSKCLEIYPKRGMAVIWCNIKKDGTPDERVVHSGQPLVPAPAPVVKTNMHVTDAPTTGTGFMDQNGECCDDSTLKKKLKSHPVVKYAMNIWACED